MDYANTKFAVVCENVYKSFDKKDVVLNGVTVHIAEGKIYGLLGPSGCGKTTLLGCLTGKIKADSGFLKVFGENPINTIGSQIGYMPQSIALSGILNVKETMWLFGRLAGLDSIRLTERTDFLLTLLNMRKREDSPISKLSGGEQRRISFAVTLLNEAPLLILDEPTVGVDSTLRENIWRYLEILTRSSNTTVIVTTHYIEEAIRSDCVGFMCKGKIIANSSPNSLKDKYQCSTLEQVFLQLCLARENKDEESDEDRKNAHLEFCKKEDDASSMKEKLKKKWRRFFNWSNLMTLAYTWHLKTKHLPGVVLFQLLYPLLVYPLLRFSHSPTPRKVPIAVVNFDSGDLGETFLQNMAPDMFTKVPYDTYDEALQAADAGKASVVVSLTENFTTSCYLRLQSLLTENASGVMDGAVNVYVERNFPIIEHGFELFFMSYHKTFLEGFNNNVTVPNDLLQDTDDISGPTDEVISSFLLTGIVIASTQICLSTVAAVLIVNFRQDGYFDRLNFAGVSKMELLQSLILHQSVLLIAFTVVVMFSVLFVVRMECNGSYLLVFLIIFCHGVSTLYLGILMASVSVNNYMVAVLIDFVAISTIFLQGVYEPVDYNSGFSSVYLWAPAAYPIIALRGILQHAWTLTHPTVLTALAVNVAWILFSLIISIVTFRFSE